MDAQIPISALDFADKAVLALINAGARVGNRVLREIVRGVIVDYSADRIFVIVESNIKLCGADNSTILVLIIILLICRYVNRTDDISGAVVDIEKLRTSN